MDPALFSATPWQSRSNEVQKDGSSTFGEACAKKTGRTLHRRPSRAACSRGGGEREPWSFRLSEKGRVSPCRATSFLCWAQRKEAKKGPRAATVLYRQALRVESEGPGACRQLPAGSSQCSEPRRFHKGSRRAWRDRSKAQRQKKLKGRRAA